MDPPFQIAPKFSLNPLKASWSPLGSRLAACERGKEPERTTSLTISASVATVSISSLSILPWLHFSLDLICPLYLKALSYPLLSSPLLNSLHLPSTKWNTPSWIRHHLRPVSYTVSRTNTLAGKRKCRHDRDTDALFLSSFERKKLNLMIIRYFFLELLWIHCRFTFWRQSQLFFSKDSLSTLCLWSVIVLLSTKHGIIAGNCAVAIAMARMPAASAGSAQTESRYCFLMKAALCWLHSLLLKQSYSWKWLEIIGAGCCTFHIQTLKSKRPKKTKSELRSVWVYILCTYVVIIQYAPWNINDLNNLAFIQITKHATI